MICFGNNKYIMMIYNYLHKKYMYYNLPNLMFFTYIWQVIYHYNLPNRIFFTYIWQIINTIKIKI
jgi:hypothetical protein